MGVGSEGLLGLTNDCVDISTRNTPGRSCRAVRREPRHSPSPRLSSTVNTSRSADSTTEDWYFHKLNTIVHVDLCANAWLFPPSTLFLDNGGKWNQPCVVLYLPICCSRAHLSRKDAFSGLILYFMITLLFRVFFRLKSQLSLILTYRLQIVRHFSKVIVEICDLAPRQVM